MSQFVSNLISSLAPQQHVCDDSVFYIFPSSAIDILRIDLLFEAGSFYQPAPLVSEAACRLFTDATQRLSSQQVAEFLDYRGIAFDRDRDTYTSSITLFVLKKYAHEMLPLLHEMFTQPTFPMEEFDLFKARMYQKILQQQQKTSSVVYNLMFKNLYGADHPLARFATPDDAQSLSRQQVIDFFFEHYKLDKALIVLSGAVTDEILAQAHQLFHGREVTYDKPCCTVPPHPSGQRIVYHTMPSAQTSVRVSRLLPIGPFHDDFYPLSVLNTLLGGYFGSRLMSNVREDKGYTYGINSFITCNRHDTRFSIGFDAGNDVALAAIDEVKHELQVLCNDKVSADELLLVQNTMMGDFVRSVDGVFERAELFGQHFEREKITHHMHRMIDAVRNTTPEDLMRLAQTYLNPDSMDYFAVGQFSSPAKD